LMALAMTETIARLTIYVRTGNAKETRRRIAPAKTRRIAHGLKMGTSVTARLNA